MSKRFFDALEKMIFVRATNFRDSKRNYFLWSGKGFFLRFRKNKTKGFTNITQNLTFGFFAL